MITVEPLTEWKERQVFEEVDTDCDECGGDGECSCCERECLECGGTGKSGMQQISEKEVEQRYFNDVMDSIKRLCAFSTRHDFLTEAGDFIKSTGRLDLPPWHRTVH